MKKFVILVFILFLDFVNANAQYVTIPDANFVTWLTQNYPSCIFGNQMDTTCNEIIIEDTVIVSLMNITNITGVEYFDNLIYLKCNANLIDSLPRLPSTLIHLNCHDNQLTSLPALPLTLKVLECAINQITYLPQLPSTLTRLICNNNQLSYLPTLPNALTNLDCYNNQLTALPLLPNNLIILYSGNNQISMITGLPNSLRLFDCSGNPISTIPTLPNELTSLNCDLTLITSLPNPLPDSLQVLNCGGNQLTSLPTLPNNLLILQCQQDLLTSLPAIPPSLSQLTCSYNNLTSLPLMPNQMNTFYIDHNNISCLVNLPQVSGIFVYIDNNPFTCVPNQTSYSASFPLCLANDFINNPQNCPSVANLTGKIFLDLDINCSLSLSDSLAEHVPVKLYDSQNNLIAQSYTVNGMYSFAALQADSFKVEINESDLQVLMTCGQPNSILVSLDSTNQTLSNLDFGLMCEGVLDIKVQSITTQGVVFPGQTHKLITNIINNESYYNLICDTIYTSGTVTIEISGPCTYLNPANGALIPSVNANTFTYNISNFNDLNFNSFGLNLLIDTTAQLGDQICVYVAITPTPIDANTNNNTLAFCYHVLNSFDPNIKEVYPVDVYPGFEDWLTYSIHFQNTGNAAAINIGLKDTLDSKLNINTFEILGSSHPANTSIFNNIITVRFNDIMLPDSTTDYEGSMGYFQYRIKPKPNQPLGTQIKNTAYIYFDYNTPIITNTTQNNFVTGLNENLVSVKNEYIIYPNPSNGIFNFKDTKNIKQVEVYNLLGEQVLAQGNEKQINLNGFAKGIYYARINGEVVVKLVND